MDNKFFCISDAKAYGHVENSPVNDEVHKRGAKSLYVVYPNFRDFDVVVCSELS